MIYSEYEAVERGNGIAGHFNSYTQSYEDQLFLLNPQMWFVTSSLHAIPDKVW